MPVDTECVYCGDRATDWDHVVPHSRTGKRKRDYSGWIVPACQSCNVQLSDRVMLSVADRAAWLYNRLKKKYRKLLVQPTWDEIELDELDDGLRSAVVYAQIRQRILDVRLLHLQMIARKPWDYLRPDE